MSKGKLTRQELSWLLTQEAQGAAERLRKGVTALTGAPPPPGAPGTDSSGVDATLSALDDAMKMLSSLHARPATGGRAGRRGRIDVASLIWEVAPEARVSIEPGSGTEIFGDESELRRLLHVMLGHGSGSGSAVTIRRARDEVVVAVALGPDSSATAETERAWLSRMAIRYGGRFELEGGSEVLALPAEGVEARSDVEKLRKELDEARKQGEAYARELAAVWATGEEPVAPSSYPPPSTPATDRCATIARLSGGIAATLRAMLSPIAQELSELRGPPVTRKSNPEIALQMRVDMEERVEAVRRRLVSAQEFVGDLACVGELDLQEAHRESDLSDIVREQMRALEARASRAGVQVRLVVADDAGGTGARAPVRVAPRSAGVLARVLLAHAILATPRGAEAIVTVYGRGSGERALGARIIVDDGGTVLPAAARRSLLALEVEPGTFGRPSSVGLFVAAEIAVAIGALFDVGDVPPDVGAGVRVSVTFPR